jgi:flagellar biosynthesis/type III secretory pathway M-ring protein FliF/YscJ
MGSFAINTAVSQFAPSQTLPPATQDGLPDMTPQQTEFVQWVLTQGGVTLVLLFVLGFYRRDFFRKIEAGAAEYQRQLAEKQAQIDRMKEEKREAREVLRDNAAAAQAMALAIAQNTNATNNLAGVIQSMDRRRPQPDA